MKLLWAAAAREDDLHWQQNHREIAGKLNLILADVRPTPFKGPGEPAPSRDVSSGRRSRRITGEHRLVYRIAGRAPDQRIEIVQCRYH